MTLELQTAHTILEATVKAGTVRRSHGLPLGFTVIELVVVVSMIGLLVVLATPSLARSWDSERVRAAKVMFTGMHAKARATAIQRGSASILVIDGSRILIHSVHPVTGAADTIRITDLADQFGVGLSASRDSLQFDTRGIGTEPSGTYVVITKNSLADTMRISRTGIFY